MAREVMLEAELENPAGSAPVTVKVNDGYLARYDQFGDVEFRSVTIGEDIQLRPLGLGQRLQLGSALTGEDRIESSIIQCCANRGGVDGSSRLQGSIPALPVDAGSCDAREAPSAHERQEARRSCSPCPLHGSEPYPQTQSWRRETQEQNESSGAALHRCCKTNRRGSHSCRTVCRET